MLEQLSNLSQHNKVEHCSFVLSLEVYTSYTICFFYSTANFMTDVQRHYMYIAIMLNNPEYNSSETWNYDMSAVDPVIISAFHIKVLNYVSKIQISVFNDKFTENVILVALIYGSQNITTSCHHFVFCTID